MSGLRQRDQSSTTNNMAPREHNSQECYSNETPTGKEEDELGTIYPDTTFVSPREYNVLAHFSGTTTKLYLSMTEFLENFDLRYKMNLDVNPNVFLKVFEIYWMKALHGMFWNGRKDIPEEQLNESDQYKMGLLDNFEMKDSINVEERAKFTYLRELIALKRIETWNRNHPDEQINTAKLLQYGWIILYYPEDRTYGGPFLAFENLQFIGRNDIDETPKRWQSFRRQESLLLRAGIVHNDFKSSNICFDYNDECFIIDFGMSVVDDDKIFNRYEIEDLMSPG